jgi:uncharacterized protein (TIGR03067 family)
MSSHAHGGKAMRAALALVLTGFSAVSVEGADDKEQAEFKKLEGTWVLVSEERNGEKRFPPKSLWIFEGEAAKVYFEPPPPNAPKNWSPSVKPINVMQIYHFKLDPTQTPKALEQTTEYRDRKTLEFGEKKTPTKPENLTKPKIAIYKLDGDTLTICYAGYYDKGKRPGDFTAAKKSDRFIYILQREKK